MGAVAPTLIAGTALAGGIAQGLSQAKAGKAYADSMTRQAEYNAQIYENQAAMIQSRKKIEDYQYKRAAKKLRSTVVSKTAGKGLQLTGSPLAIMIDNESQLLFDQAISEYNLDVQANYARSAAANTRYVAQENARYAKSAGNSNAFSSILNTFSNFNKLYPILK